MVSGADEEQMRADRRKRGLRPKGVFSDSEDQIERGPNQKRKIKTSEVAAGERTESWTAAIRSTARDEDHGDEGEIGHGEPPEFGEARRRRADSGGMQPDDRDGRNNSAGLQPGDAAVQISLVKPSIFRPTSPR
jgi:hypothetical protein